MPLNSQATPNNSELAGQVAVATGGVRGIGRAIAATLSEARMTTAVLARSASEIAETARRIEQAGTLLVNAARGGLIDYRALRDALSVGHLGGVGLDVYWTEPFLPDDPLLKLPNIIATPHVAGVTDRSYVDIADAVATIACSSHGATAKPGRLMEREALSRGETIQAGCHNYRPKAGDIRGTRKRCLGMARKLLTDARETSYWI